MSRLDPLDRQFKLTQAALAKPTVTGQPQRVIDRAVQMFGGLGVTRGAVVESLYREIRALRLHEDASEVLSLIMRRDLLHEVAARDGYER